MLVALHFVDIAICSVVDLLVLHENLAADLAVALLVVELSGFPRVVALFVFPVVRCSFDFARSFCSLKKSSVC